MSHSKPIPWAGVHAGESLLRVPIRRRPLEHIFGAELTKAIKNSRQWKREEGGEGELQHQVPRTSCVCIAMSEDLALDAQISRTYGLARIWGRRLLTP
jgi:hypothetical protein